MSEGPVAIVTAAGGGIGTACARELAEQGYRLVLMSRSESVHNLATELGGVGLQGSVEEGEDVTGLVTMALERFGQLDAVVNNTGHAPGSSDPTGRRFDPAADAHLLDISDEDWLTGFDLYFLNVVRMARLVTEVMREQGRGAIVNISAFAAREASYAFPTSSTNRAALARFTKLYADRYAGDGIRMNDVLPGYLDNWEWSETVVGSIPAGRPGTVEEIAKVVVFLLSDEAQYVTGQGILVDGGLNR